MSVTVVSISLLVVSAWLFSRYRKERRLTGWICLCASALLHLALILFLPSLHRSSEDLTNQQADNDQQSNHQPVEFSTFDPDQEATTESGLAQTRISPLPVSNMTSLTEDPDFEVDQNNVADTASDTNTVEAATVNDDVPLSTQTEIASALTPDEPKDLPDLHSEFDSLLDNAFAGLDAIDPETVTEPAIASNQIDDMSQERETNSEPKEPSITESSEDTSANDVAKIAPRETNTDSVNDNQEPKNPVTEQVAELANPLETPPATVLADTQNDFANRTGLAKTTAIRDTGGNEESEAAVQRALQYLVRTQREDGAWDPRTSGAGLERAPLGTSRGAAGSRADTAITGLALLSLMGAGHTHQNGQYADNVYRGLAFLIHQQKPAGSMAGRANIYEATYCHGMAALAMCEAAAITQDASAILSAQRAIAHTQRLQHPVTGGWRYTEGDPGDLSQLGWQAMVLDAGSRAGIKISMKSANGVQTFLRSVQSGRHGGLATYRLGEKPSRTMTAEALATRLLIGDEISDAAIKEAEAYVMEQLPGVGQDNYYYWYYATIALHQLQNNNWNRWNQALQKRLLATQLADGSWPTNTLWGGYGGKIYTTAMATLCLETYYRHVIRNNKSRIAQQPDQPFRR